MNIPFSPPDITQKEIDLVSEALRSGWITTGPKTKLFEKKISEYTGAAGTVCLNSATSAMELTLRLLGIGPGDEVITSAYTYTASASVICHVGATPVLVDPPSGAFHITADVLEHAITPKTKAIIPVDIGGVMCDHPEIIRLAESKKSIFIPANDIQSKLGRIAVLADAAHSFGASQNGVASGCAADFSCFSFHAVKNLTTAEGGAVCWASLSGIDSDWLYHQYMLLSLHGQTKDALAKNKSGAWEYDILTPAYKCNMTDLNAALGLAQLERYGGMLARRQALIARYDEAIADAGFSTLKHYDNKNTSSGHLYLCNLTGKDAAYRNTLIEKLAENGVATNVHYKPLPLLTAYKNMGFDIMDFPNACRQFETEITLPLYSIMTDEQQGYVIEQFLKNL